MLLRVAATGLVLKGAISTRAYVAIREMKFKKWAFVSNGGGILGVFITVVLSFYIRDVWALVIGYVAENAARAIFSFALCPMVPRFPPQKEALHDLLRFSKGLLGLSLLNLIFIRTDVFALAKLYSPGALGVYAMAIYLAQTPSSFVINLLNQTLLPTFSHLRDDSDRMNRILLRSTSVTLMLGAPMVRDVLFLGQSCIVDDLRPAVCQWRFSLLFCGVCGVAERGEQSDHHGVLRKRDTESPSPLRCGDGRRYVGLDIPCRPDVWSCGGTNSVCCGDFEWVWHSNRANFASYGAELGSLREGFYSSSLGRNGRRGDLRRRKILGFVDQTPPRCRFCWDRLRIRIRPYGAPFFSTAPRNCIAKGNCIYYDKMRLPNL